MLIERTMAPKAKKLKSGDSVTVLAHKVVGMRAASARYGINSKIMRVSGNITGSNGRGRSRKCVVFFPVFNKSKEFSSRSLAIGDVLVHTTSNGIASAVNDEAGSNSVNEEVANEVAVGSDEDEATVNERDTAGTNEEENEISMNEELIAGNADHLDDSLDLLMCNEVKRSVVRKITEDSRYMPRFNAAILWSDSTDVKDKTIMDFFWMSFPSQMISNIIK